MDCKTFLQKHVPVPPSQLPSIQTSFPQNFTDSVLVKNRQLLECKHLGKEKNLRIRMILDA